MFKNSERLFYSSPANEWTEALPIGNGKIGAMIFGTPDSEKIALNHDELWSGKPGCGKFRFERQEEDRSRYFFQARELTLNGAYFKAQELLEDNFIANWSQAYLPFGNLYITDPEKGDCTAYSRELDICNAVSFVQYTKNSVTHKRTYFLSNPDNIFVAQFTNNSDFGKDYIVSFDSPLLTSTSHADDCFIIDGECPIKIDVDKNNGVKDKFYQYDKNEKGICFRGLVKVVDDSADIYYLDDKIVIKNSKSMVVYFTAETSFNGYNNHPSLAGKEYKNKCQDYLSKAVSKGYQLLRDEHICDYKKYYDRVSIDLCGKDVSDIETDTRLRNFKTDKSDLDLYALLFNYGRYLTIAASRENTQPMNLQGIWNDKAVPPWNSNYTVNINTEMNYWPALICDLDELNQPLIDLVHDISVTGEETAKNFYHANGFVCHHNVDLWRYTTPVPGSSCWSFWFCGSGWLCHHLFEHYEYTDDRDFLKKTAYPIMKRAAEFYLDILIEDKEGYLIAAPSTSPENMFITENNERCAISETSYMTMGTIRDLFSNIIKSCDILNTDSDFRNLIAANYDKLLPYKIGSKGQLLEWYQELPEEDPHHRHTSHLYALHPADLITKEKTPDLFEACKKTLEIRGDAGTGWSLGWKINFWARLLDGDHALKLLDNQLSFMDPVVKEGHVGGGTYPNMFDAHPPFQIDGNFGATSGICEMLLRSLDDRIYLLPALPSKWQNGAVRGLKAKGNIKVDISWEDGKLKDYTLTPGNKSVKVIYKDKILNGLDE